MQRKKSNFIRCRWYWGKGALLEYTLLWLANYRVLENWKWSSDLCLVRSVSKMSGGLFLWNDCFSMLQHDMLSKNFHFFWSQNAVHANELLHKSHWLIHHCSFRPDSNLRNSALNGLWRSNEERAGIKRKTSSIYLDSRCKPKNCLAF